MITQSVSTKTRRWVIEDPESARGVLLGFWRQNTMVVLISLLLGPLAGLLVSYAFKPTYNSQALILMETTAPQELQSSIEKDAAEPSARLWQLLSQSRLEQIVQRNNLGARIASLEQIRENIRILPASAGSTHDNEDSSNWSHTQGFYVQYTASSPPEAQGMCNELTLTLLQENLNSWQPVTEDLADTLRQLDDAKRNIEEQQAKLASFDGEHMGQSGGNREEDGSVLLDLEARQQQISQSIKQAQENKSHAVSLLAQKLMTDRKPDAPPVNTAALEKQLSRLQSQLIQLEAQYADDHPDVVKTKADISDLERKLREANGAGSKTNTRSNVEESPEAGQLQLQIQHYDAVIADARLEQTQIRGRIKTYQRRANASSAVEKQQRRLEHESEAAQNSYDELLADKTYVKDRIERKVNQPAEMIRMLRPANLPFAPSFPNRKLFAATGLLASLLGSCLAFTFKLRQKRLL